MKNQKTLVVCSGGLDSVTLAYQVAAEQQLAGLLSFNYNQRHQKEIQFAQLAAKRLGCSHQVIDISNIGTLLISSLTDTNISVPEGHYSHENMASTVVPNRNAIMLSIAFGLAQSMQANAVGIAVHGGDHFIYPDCRPEFIAAFAHMQKLSLGTDNPIELYAPYLHISKGEIAKQSVKFNVPIDETWSCYKGEETHCGRCGTCVERLEAVHEAQAVDATEYQDKQFWQETTSAE